MHRPARKSLLVGLVWGMLTLALLGQDRARNPATESHIPLPPGSTNRADAERLLRERLGKAKDFHQGNEQLQKLLQEIKDDPSKYFSKDQMKLIEKLPKPGDQEQRSMDPELIRFLQEWAKTQKQLRENQGKVPQLENLERFLQEEARKHPKIGPTDTPKGDAPSPTPLPSDQRPVPPRPSPIDQAKDDQWRKGIVKAVERTLDPSKNSDTLKRAQQDLLRPSSRWGEDWAPFAKAREGLRSELPDVGKSLRLDRLVKEGDRFFRGPPKWPDMNDSPNPPSPFRGGSGGGGLPAISPPEVSEGAGMSLLLWLIMGAVLAVLLWKIMSTVRRSRDENEEAWRLGAWPVNPGAVTTRDELVKAFDYLTLLCLGPPARFWNHREIGHRLGSEQAQKQQAAEELTELYEHARYAPPEELLPPGEMETARRHLCFLAGASAA